MVDWKKKYTDLALFLENYIPKLQAGINELTKQADHLRSIIRENNKTVLAELGMVRLLRLKEDYEADVEYNDHWQKKFFKAGTLIDSDNGYVYLDDDGDGNIHFPMNICEFVNLRKDEVDWNNVLNQG